LASIAPEEPLTLNIAREWLKREDSPEHLMKAAGLLWQLGNHGKDAVPDLIAVLQFKPVEDKFLEQRVKMGALSALKSMGSAANGALPILRAMMATEDITLRQHVAATIKGVE